MHSLMISIGNFFFKYRNKVFPLIVVSLFALAVPPSDILGSEALEDGKDCIAIFIAFLGLAIRGITIGFAYIKRGGMNKKVYADNLVTEGMFAICRNPLYVGNILVCIAIFLMHGDPMVMIVGISLYVFIYCCIVAAEEAYLLNKFGDAYRAYCADVPRWIPKFSQFREATEGMKFDFKKVIIKDYSTIGTTVITLALIEMYEYLAMPHIDKPYIALLTAIILASGLAIWAVSNFKKRTKRLHAPSA